MTALYRCLTCAHEWEQAPGPTQCPLCGALYVKWLNFADLFGLDQHHSFTRRRLPATSRRTAAAKETEGK